jgi:hypothetical protein
MRRNSGYKMGVAYHCGASMKGLAFGALLATSILMACIVSAIAEDSETACTRLDPVALDQNIAACTALIQSNPPAQSGPSAMLYRGMAYHLQRQYTRAIEDYDAALKMARGEVEADILYYRGAAKLRSGDTTGGNSDVSAAKVIRPNIGIGVNMMARSHPAFERLVAPADIRLTPRPTRLWRLAPQETK